MHIQEATLLAPLTSFRIGGEARYFIEAITKDDVIESIDFADKNNLPVFILGAGSNILVSDEGFEGLVLRMVNDDVSYFDEGDTVVVVAGAGKSWDTLVEEVVLRDLFGFENLSGIPSSVGASAVQNIGAYGVEVGQLIEWVEVYDPHSREMKKLSTQECEFGYRESTFKHQNGKSLVIFRVAYRLKKEGRPNLTYKDLDEYHHSVREIVSLQDVREAVLAIRLKKFPLGDGMGTAGSFFKNPIVKKSEMDRIKHLFPEILAFPQTDGTFKLSAGWIIDHVLSLKGVREGNVGTWETQALVIVNYGGATAVEVKKFASNISQKIDQTLGVSLTPEVIFVGEKNN